MEIDRKELLAALEPLKPAIPSRTSIVELTHIWFDKENAYAYDNGMGIQVKVSTPFDFGVPGTVLLNLLSQTSADKLTLEAKDNVLAFKAGRSNVKIATLPSDRRVWPYPITPEGKPVASLKASDAFLAGLKRVFVVRPANPKRMEHYAVCIWRVDKEMDLYTTDSAKIAVFPVGEPITGKIDKLALPRTFAEQMVSRCKNAPTLQLYTDHFRVVADEKISLYSNVLDATDMLNLPDYVDRYCDEKAAPPFGIPDGFNATLERASLIAGSEEPVVVLTTSGKRLTVAGKFNVGELDEAFELKRSVPKCSLEAITRFLLLPKDVERMMVSPTAVVFHGKDKDGFLYILAGHGRSAPGAAASAEASQEELASAED